MTLTEPQIRAMCVLCRDGGAWLDSLAFHMFGKRTGIFLAMARGRFRELERAGFAVESCGLLFPTEAGRAAFDAHLETHPWDEISMIEIREWARRTYLSLASY